MSNLNRKLIGHLCTLQSSERFIARFHFVAKFIIQFISKSKAHSICVLSVVIHKCYTVLFFYMSVPISIKIYLDKRLQLLKCQPFIPFFGGI